MGRGMVHSSPIVTRIAKADEPGKIFRLTDMDVEEVSLVDRAANKRKFLVVKRSDQMTVQVQPDGKGGFTSRTSAGKNGKTKTAKAGFEVPPGFKEMVSPLITKASEMLAQLEADVAGSKPAEVGEEGEIPGVPADFVTALQGVMALLDKACNLYPAAPADPDAETEDAPSPEGDGGADEASETQMQMALDNIGKVLGGKVQKAAILKVGAKMSKDRFTRLQQAAQVLTHLIGELSPGVGGTAPAAAPPVGKTQKNANGTPVAADPQLSALAQQIGGLVEQVGKLAGVVKTQGSQLAGIQKSRGAPSAGQPEGGPTPAADAGDYSWPMDMNNPITRDTVEKTESFFDEK